MIGDWDCTASGTQSTDTILEHGLRRRFDRTVLRKDWLLVCIHHPLHCTAKMLAYPAHDLGAPPTLRNHISSTFTNLPARYSPRIHRSLA